MRVCLSVCLSCIDPNIENDANKTISLKVSSYIHLKVHEEELISISSDYRLKNQA